MPGPPPKHPSQRRRANKDLTQDILTRLPAGGRTGAVPDWPLADQDELEAEVWAGLWRTPQAAAWENLGWVRAVARYTRVVVRAEARDAPASLMAECRQLEDRLGLHPLSMLRLRWTIDTDDEVAAAREERAPEPRRRLKAVDTSAVARAE